MTNALFQVFKQELINKGFLLSEYETLHSIHEWGFILYSSYNNDRFIFYDYNYNVICILDNTDWYIIENVLYSDIFEFNLTIGAPVVLNDVTGILKNDNTELLLFYNGTIGVFASSGTLVTATAYPLTVQEYIDQGYELLPKEQWQNSLNMFNTMIIIEDLVKHII